MTEHRESTSLGPVEQVAAGLFEPGDEMIEALARVSHESNRAYCIYRGDLSQPAWDEAPEWQKRSARNGVRGALKGNTPEQSHKSWLDEKVREGWVYGAVKDVEKKTHPCMVSSYDELPPYQRKKDEIYIAVISAFYVSAFCDTAVAI